MYRKVAELIIIILISLNNNILIYVICHMSTNDSLTILPPILECFTTIYLYICICCNECGYES